MKLSQAIFAIATLGLAAGLFSFTAQKANADTTTGSCPRVTATRYVAGGGGILSGDHYVITVANEDCAWVSSWVKKIVAQHVSGAPDEDRTVKGPQGYACTASPDNQGHPYQGKCEKNGDQNTGFSWVMGG